LLGIGEEGRRAYSREEKEGGKEKGAYFRSEKEGGSVPLGGSSPTKTTEGGPNSREKKRRKRNVGEGDRNLVYERKKRLHL